MRCQICDTDLGDFPTCDPFTGNMHWPCPKCGASQRDWNEWTECEMCGDMVVQETLKVHRTPDGTETDEQGNYEWVCPQCFDEPAY